MVELKNLRPDGTIGDPEAEAAVESAAVDADVDADAADKAPTED